MSLVVRLVWVEACPSLVFVALEVATDGDGGICGPSGLVRRKFYGLYRYCQLMLIFRASSVLLTFFELILFRAGILVSSAEQGAPFVGCGHCSYLGVTDE